MIEKSEGASLPSTNAVIEAQRLISYLKAIARLRLEIKSFQKDQETVKNGGHIFYCIDTNILQLFARPNLEGPRNERGGGGYGIVFPDDFKEQASTLGAVLSRFIFYDLVHKLRPLSERGLPLILLIGHDAEVHFVFDLLLRDERHYRERLTARRNQLASILRMITSETDQEKRIEIIRDQADDLLRRLFFDDFPADQFIRYSSLLTDGRISRLSSITESLIENVKHSVSSTKVRSALTVPITLVDQIEESSYRISWTKRLHAENPTRSERTLHPDASALARLELINRRLAGTAITLALITGDEGMYRAGSKYFPHRDSKLDFSMQYLRHPRAFLSADEVLVPGEAEDFRDGRRSFGLISNWLDTLLARYTSDRGPEIDAMRAIVSEAADGKSGLQRRVEDVLKADPVAAIQIRQQWDQHVSALRDEHSSASRLAREEIGRFLGSAVKTDEFKALELIDRRLAQISEGTWQSFFEAVVRTGYDIAVIGAHFGARRSRNAPPIDFSSFVATKEFVREVVSDGGLIKLKPDEMQSRIDKIAAEDKTGTPNYSLLRCCSLTRDVGTLPRCWRNAQFI